MDIKAAMHVPRFAQVAKNINRLIGLLNDDEKLYVTKMNSMPTREMLELTRSVMERAFTCWSVRPPVKMVTVELSILIEDPPHEVERSLKS